MDVLSRREHIAINFWTYSRVSRSPAALLATAILIAASPSVLHTNLFRTPGFELYSKKGFTSRGPHLHPSASCWLKAVPSVSRYGVVICPRMPSSPEQLPIDDDDACSGDNSPDALPLDDDPMAFPDEPPFIGDALGDRREDPAPVTPGVGVDMHADPGSPVAEPAEIVVARDIELASGEVPRLGSNLPRRGRGRPKNVSLVSFIDAPREVHSADDPGDALARLIPAPAPVEGGWGRACVPPSGTMERSRSRRHHQRLQVVLRPGTRSCNRSLLV